MSIPPLVCSTPPPPEQCEDEKDPEDFDIPYNLSQEDYDESYDYGNFSTYGQFESSTTNLQKEEILGSTKNIQNVIPCESTEVQIEDSKLENDEHSSSPEYCSKHEEDNNIEDLNLKLEEESIDKTNLPIDVEIEANTPPQLESSGNELISPNNTEPEQEHVIDSYELPVANLTDDIADQTEPENLPFHESSNVIDNENEIEPTIERFEKPNDLNEYPTETVLQSNKNDSVDGFDDFEDFQFISTDPKPAVIFDNSDNPWSNNEEPSEDFAFGDFKANFNEDDNNVTIHPELQAAGSTEGCKEESLPENNDHEDLQDDFGDFNDFKSSAVKVESNMDAEEEEWDQQIPVLQLSEDENQNEENINNIINTLFTEEIPGCESDVSMNLDNLLGETWGHLLEIEVRQPYILNWNNSRSQKTLLKSLSIDSRNILFGPKWSYNMPKYAVNLSAAPLKPQKQAPALSSEATTSTTKTSSNWNDPLTSDGQESCKTETPDAAIDTGPTDLDVFEAGPSSKPDKIYSSTLSVQPLRQINLPDTHIFTPTDSETPRSKTIHYDSSPSILLPQPVLETNKNNPESQPSLSSLSDSKPDSKPEDDNEYWEFKSVPVSNLKQTTEETSNSVPAVKSLPNPSVTYGTQVLQPIKVEPLMPTLNWPDPGEVKETFDDFSDFVSSLSWPKAKQESSGTPTTTEILENAKPPTGDKLNTDIETTSSQNVTMEPASNAVDDDFDTFQSALPTQAVMQDTVVAGNSASMSDPNKISKPIMTTPSTLDFTSTIQNRSTSMPANTAASVPQPEPKSFVENNFNVKAEHSKSLPIQPAYIPHCTPGPFGTSLLQPTPASSSSSNHIQPKSTQILEPLSLESFSQINWPNPGVDLQDFRFNPIESFQSLKTELSVNSHSKGSPINARKGPASQAADDDWGEFVSGAPAAAAAAAQQALPKKSPLAADDDEWTDFVSSPSVKPQNGLNTISLNVHTNLSIQKSSNQVKIPVKKKQLPLDIPSLNYITPKSSSHKTYNDRHFQNL